MDAMKTGERLGAPGLLLRGIWGAAMALVLILLALSPWIRYACKKDFLPPVLLAALGLLFVALLWLLLRRLPVPRGLPAVTGLLFLALQLVLLRAYFFKTDWDSAVLTYTAERVAAGLGVDAGLEDYFSTYPNNVLLAWVYVRLFCLAARLGLAASHGYMLLLGLQCALSFAGGLLCFRLAETLTGERGLAFLCQLLYLLLLGLSPWVSIPYSDAAGLCFPVLLLVLYVRAPARRLPDALRCFAIGFFTMLGYHIKPTVFIVLLALALVSLLRLRRAAERPAVLAARASLVLAGLLCASLLVSCARNDFPCRIDPERRLGAAHFLAMGHNGEAMGVWADEDVLFSKGFATNRERDAADLALARERVRALGAGGLLRLYGRKLLTVFGDGTFAWWQEGEFCVKTYGDPPGPFAAFVRSLYYRDGSRHALFMNTAQALWLALLCLSFAAAFRRAEKGAAAAMLTILGLMAYFLLFEVRARYMYIFAPLFPVLAVCGLQALVGRER